jgi:hypothetical protein
MHSPLISETIEVPEGKLEGKAAVSEYWSIGLATAPKLCLLT